MQKNIFIICLIACNLTSCIFGKCKKVPLKKEELNWFSTFKQNDTLYYKSESNLDTFVCGEVYINYTDCNKFELGEFQYNEASVSLYDTKKNYKIGMSFSKSGQKDTSSYCYKRIGVFDFDYESENEKFILNEITLRNGRKYNCVFLKSDNKNSYINQVYWSPTNGLIKYVKANKETYELVE